MPIKSKQRKDSPYWWIRGTHQGKYIYQSTGLPHSGKSREPKQVTDLIRKLEQDIENEQLHGIGYNKTFKDAAAMYLAKGGSPRFLLKVMEEIGHLRMNEITQDILDNHALKLYGHCTPQTINRQFYTPFIAVWNSSQPERKWKKLKTRQTRVSRATKAILYEDAITFINALSLPVAEVMFFLFYTGCRPIEAINLRGDDINLEGKWITLNQTKTNEPRGVPIHESLIPLLTRIKEQDGFKNSRGHHWPDNRLLNKTGRTQSHRGGQFDSPLRTAQNKTGIKITPYNARHTVATYLIYPGGVEETIKNEILGHGDRKDVSLDYVHLPRQSLLDAINKLPTPENLRKELLL